MDPLELAWQEFRNNPHKAGAFAEIALTLVEAELRPDPRDPQAVGTAAVDAVWTLVRRPDAFKPEKGRLLPYLIMSARGDLRNAQQKEARHHRNRDHTEGVELLVPARNEEYEPPPAVIDPARLQAVADALSPADRAVYDLWLTGERSTDKFAAVMGITDRPADEWPLAVKRAKDRIKARIKRAGGG